MDEKFIGPLILVVAVLVFAGFVARKIPVRFVGWLAVSMAAVWIWPYLISAPAATEGWVSLILPDASSRVVVVAFALGFMLVLWRFRGVLSHPRFSQ